MQHPDDGKIQAWLDGEVSFDEGIALEGHLAFCDECTARVAELRGLMAGAARILSALDDVPAGIVPAAAGPSVMAGETVPADDVVPISAAATRRWWKTWWRSPWVHAAAVVLIVGAGLMLRPKRMNERDLAMIDTSEAAPVPAGLSPVPPVVSAPESPSEEDRAAAETSAVAAAQSIGDASGARTAPPPPTPEPSAPTVAEARRPDTLAEQKLAAAAPQAANRPAAGAGADARLRVDTSRPREVRVVARDTVEAARATDSIAQLRSAAATGFAVTERARQEQSAAAARLAAPAPAPADLAADASAAGVLQHRLTGCYAIDSLAWEPALTASEAALVPTFLQLDSLTATGGPAMGKGLLHPGPASLVRQYSLRSWEPTAADRATITLRGDAGTLTIALAANGRGFAILSRPDGTVKRSSLVASGTSCR